MPAILTTTVIGSIQCNSSNNHINVATLINLTIKVIADIMIANILLIFKFSIRSNSINNHYNKPPD